MDIKAGTTAVIVREIPLEKACDKVIFTLKSGSSYVEKTFNNPTITEPTTVFVLELTQEDTIKLQGHCSLEAQINYSDKSVPKTLTEHFFIADTLATEIVEGNKPSEEDGVPLVMKVIKDGVVLMITPESSQELIDQVIELFNDTKDIAQSVRDDADAGKFDGKDGADGRDGVDGQDGFSPTVEVKTQTADTYILDITDKNGTTETPNLKGPKGDKGDKGDAGDYTAGNGIDIVNDVISVDIDDLANTRTDSGNVLRKEVDGKLAVYTSVIANDTVFQNTMPFYPGIRQGLVDTSYNYPLASKSYVDGLMSGAVKRQVVQTLPISDIDENTIYMLPKATAETDNIYDEYMYINNAWELIGTTEVDLTDYYTKTEVNTALSNKQDTINASNKLNADYLSDGTTSKPSYWNKAPKVYEGSTVPTTNWDDYYGCNVGDLYIQRANAYTDATKVYQCVLDYMGTVHWKEIPYLIDIKQLPSSAQADEGKFLRVNAQGNAEWQTDNKQDKTTITTNTTDTTVSLTLADNNEYRYTQDLASLTLTMPSGDFISSVVFVSGTTPTQMTYDSNIKWSGDDVTSNAFVPQASKTYNIVFWYDGININAVARGV